MLILEVQQKIKLKGDLANVCWKKEVPFYLCNFLKRSTATLHNP